MIKALEKLRLEWTHINPIIHAYDRLRSSIILWGKLQGISLRPSMWQGNPFSLFLYNMVLEVLARATKQEETITEIQTVKEEVTVNIFANDMVMWIRDL